MAGKKIIVLKKKSVLFWILIAVVCLFLVIFIAAMSGEDPQEQVTDTAAPLTEDAKYIPGVYTLYVLFHENQMNLELICDANHINAIRISDVTEAVTTMYPLILPSIASIEQQLVNDVPIDELAISDDSKYTQQMLIEAIRKLLAKADIDR